jgi:hypothetical protein
MNHITTTKGMPMNPTEHTAKTPSPKTGLFATLRGLLRVGGSGAPKISRRSSLALALPLALAAAMVFASAPALAAPPETPELTVQSPTASEATLLGILNPKGPGEPGSSYRFLYNKHNFVTTECQGGRQTAPGLSMGHEHEELPAEPITGLQPNTEYTACLRAENAAKTERTDSLPVIFKTGEEAPVTKEAKPVFATTATLSGELSPNAEEVAEENLQPGHFEFLYKASATECTGGKTAPVPPGLALGQAKEKVLVNLTGLQPGTEYAFCLLVRNETGEASPTSTPVTFTTASQAAPKVEEEYVTEVGSSSATLSAKINPGGSETGYRFEYGTGAGYAPVPGGEGSLPEGIAAVPVSVHVQEGLSPGTKYHYRVVATNALGSIPGPDRTFTTWGGGGEFALSDGRQYEMVTPPDKHGALFFGLNWGYWPNSPGAQALVAQASAGGEAMVELASQPTEAEPQGYTSTAMVLSTRGPSAWSSQVIAPPHVEATGPQIGRGEEYRLFSEDLSRGVVQQFRNFTPLSAEASESTPYLHTDYLNGNVTEHCQSSCFTPLVTTANTREGTVFGGAVEGKCLQFICGPEFLAATPDLSHIVLSSDEVQLTSTTVLPTPDSVEQRVYEWAAGQLQPLYLLPKAEGGVGVYAGELSPVHHQLSDSGSVFFVYHGHLYLHDFTKGESVRLDGEEPGEGEASFLFASSDGSRVLFSDPRQLTSAAGGGIYECRIVALTCELELTGLSGGSFVGASADASLLYFMGAGEKLIADRHSGGKWTTTEGPVIPQTETSGFLPYSGGLPTFRISPSGRFIAFMSDQELTGYDNRDAVSGQPDEEVYLYDASSNRLVCASCNPTGARPAGAESNVAQLVAGDFSFSSGIWVAANVPPWTVSLGVSHNGQLYQPRYLSDSGRLFFDSHDALVPQDVNGTQDVYEYEPPGVGKCTTSAVTFSERSGGCVSLISSGSSAQESAFLDASETGGDVFFLTASKLVSQDYDNALDVYDAHECTAAAPCIAPPATTPPPCTTEAACKPSPTPQPSIFGLPASATFSGAGNLAPPASKPAVKSKNCKKGFVKKHNKCVKKPKPKKHKAKKASHNRRPSR